jgi:E1A-binding protein p400
VDRSSEEDDETTILAEEQLEVEIDPTNELHLLEDDNKMSVEDLRAKYAKILEEAPRDDDDNEYGGREDERAEDDEEEEGEQRSNDDVKEAVEERCTHPEQPRDITFRSMNDE